MRGEMWVKGSLSLFPLPFSQKFPACDRAKKNSNCERQVRGESQWERGGEGVGINVQRTIQCELFGNPCTAAGPKARAVFIAAPVYGTANLIFG
jgi:hypothetical protein